MNWQVRAAGKQFKISEGSIRVEQRDIYRSELSGLVKLMRGTKCTQMTEYAKVLSLVTMNMRYEKIAFKKGLDCHPYLLTREIICDARRQFLQIMEIAFIEQEEKKKGRGKSSQLTEKHKELWQEIWPRYSDEEFQEFVDLKIKRFVVNNLVDLIVGKNCVEFGCGNGAIVFALIEMGAKRAAGIDFGKKSIDFAKGMAKKRKVGNITSFAVDDVVNTRLPDNTYDFAVSNGVFHHLEAGEVKKAVEELARVLKPGSWLWYYVDGMDAISMDLWDASVAVLKDVSVVFMEDILKQMNVSRNKVVFILDGLSATYLHSSKDEVVELLSGAGFGNFRRLIGGTKTDFDADVIEEDKYGRERFGDGDIRLLCQLLKQ